MPRTMWVLAIAAALTACSSSGDRSTTTSAPAAASAADEATAPEAAAREATAPEAAAREATTREAATAGEATAHEATAREPARASLDDIAAAARAHAIDRIPFAPGARIVLRDQSVAGDDLAAFLRERPDVLDATAAAIALGCERRATTCAECDEPSIAIACPPRVDARAEGLRVVADEGEGGARVVAIEDVLARDPAATSRALAAAARARDGVRIAALLAPEVTLEDGAQARADVVARWLAAPGELDALAGVLEQGCETFRTNAASADVPEEETVCPGAGRGAGFAGARAWLTDDEDFVFWRLRSFDRRTAR